MRRAALVLGLGLALVALAPAPAAAQGDFFTDLLLPEAKERELAEAEHPKILEAFGGEYDDAALARYVGSIATFLGRTSQRPDITYRVTILNSPVVNAFALPAGYLYITRGLLALADNEAELAGVLGHEIGHVTARHIAKRYSRTMLAQGVLSIFGAVARDTQYEGLTGLLEPAAVIALQSYSRDNEHEADQLAIPTMVRAGYDPRAMASFLRRLDAHTKLAAQIAGQAVSGGGPFGLFATHPRTAERVERTVQAAAGTRVADPMVERRLYLRKIDGLLYGDDPAQGLVRGQAFIHPGLGIRFEAPPGFHLLNGQTEVIARHPNGPLIRFDQAPRHRSRSALGYLRDEWGKGQTLRDVRAIDVNGLAAATGNLRVTDPNGRKIDLRLVAIEMSRGVIYRFQFITPAQITDRFDEAFRRATYSFRRLSVAEKRAIKPYRLIIDLVGPGDTVASLAERLPFAEHKVAEFRALNGLGPDDAVVAGQLIKMVVEE